MARWRTDELPLDFVMFRDRIYACCKSGLYQLPTSIRHLDISDPDDIFCNEPPNKRPCSTAIEAASYHSEHELKVKFKKEAIAFCIEENIVFSIHKKGHEQVYIEATDLETFQCCNSNVGVLKCPNVTPTSWMAIVDKKLCVFLADKCFQGALHSRCHVPKFEETDRIGALLSLLRPGAKDSTDIIDKILGKQKVSSTDDTLCYDLKVVKFLDRNTVVVLNHDGILWQLTKSARKVEKIKIPIGYATNFKTEGVKCFIMTKYGSLYRIELPYKPFKSEETNLVSSNVADILELSEELQNLNVQRMQLSDQLGQLRLCIESNLPLEFKVHVDEHSRLLLTLSNSSASTSLRGDCWTLQVEINGHYYHFPMTVTTFLPKTKWTVRLPLSDDISLSDLPFSIRASLIYRSNGVHLQSDAEFTNQLSSLDFIQTRSSILFNEHESLPHNDEDTSFEGFVDSLQRRKNCRKSKEVISVPVIISNQCFVLKHCEFFDAIEKCSNSETICVSLFGLPLSVLVEKLDVKVRLTIRGRDIEEVLKIKCDLIHLHTEQKLPYDVKQEKLDHLISLITAMEEDDKKLYDCFMFLRENVTSV